MTGPEPDLPAEVGLALDPSVRRVDGGRVLIGGSPIRIVRLTEAGAARVDRLVAGEPVGPSPAARHLARRLLAGGLAHPRWPAPGPYGPGDVTVVVPAFGRPDGLAVTLAALAEAEPVAAVVVVDDGSPDPAALADVADAAGAVVVRRPVNGGPGAARNAGLDVATTPVVAFVDLDVVVRPGWLEPLLAHLADPRVAAVAPRVVSRPPAGEAATVWDRFEHDRSPLDLGPAEGRVAPRTRVAYVPTAALVARREAVVAVRGFDESLRFGEDVDLVWRLGEAGYEVRYEPGVVVSHPRRSGPRPWLRQRFDYGRSAAPLARRHAGAVAPVSVSAWSAAAWALVAGGQPLGGVVVAAAAASRLPRRLQALERPWAEGLRLAGGGTWAAWRPLASAVARPWWPAALVAAAGSSRARRVLAAAVLAPPVVDWWQGERSVDPLRYLALRVADDLAYGAGVWVGCAQERTLDPLRPDLHSWPGRSAAVD